MLWTSDPQAAMLGISLLVPAAAWDWRKRRVPNAIPFAGWLTGLCLRLWESGIPGIRDWAGSVLGTLVISLIFYLTGALGAGDCKLLSALSGLWPRMWFLETTGLSLVLAAALGLCALITGRGRVIGKTNRSSGTRIPFAACLLLTAVTILAAAPEGGFCS